MSSYRYSYPVIQISITTKDGIYLIKKWQIGTPDPAAADVLSRQGGLSVLAAKALASRGIDTIEKAADFFGQNDDEQYSDPFLIRDMDKACDAVSEAVENGTLICIYGDYDCDGVTATAVLSGYLTDIGGNVMTYINEREEGYGMNSGAVRKLAEQGVGLIVTVDNGIAAVAEAELCKELGIALVITDHHQPGETLPDALAVVDPHRADCPSIYKDLCGCGLALKLIAAMEGGDMDCAVEQFSDLAAVATVADVVPLTGENRALVRDGLHYLENTENMGLRALIGKAGLKAPYTSTSAAFGLVPRINAAGRIGSPSDALSLLTEEDPDEAEALAEKICELNAKRKNYENAVLADIYEKIKENPAVLDKRVLVFSGVDWHHGVVGIVAARCMEKFGRPVFLMSRNRGDTEVRGSARSFGGFSIFKALSFAADTLTKFGGHSGAGGFSLTEENIPLFDEKLQEFAHGLACDGVSFSPAVTVCGAVTPVELTTENIEGLNVLEPFGEANPRPVFLISDCVISDIIPLTGGAHTKLTLTGGNTKFAALMFGTKTAEFSYKKGDVVNVIASPEINTFGGRKSVNLRIADIRKKGINQAKLIAAEEAYYAFKRGERIDRRLIPHITPERADLAAVYKALGKDTISPFGLFQRVGRDMNYCKFLICLDVFAQSGLMAYDKGADRISVIQGAPKADTEKAPIMEALRRLAAQ